MATVVAKTGIKREKNYLYFLDKNGNVAKTKMNRKGGKKGRKTCSAAPNKKAATKKRAVKKAAPKKRAVKRPATKKRATKKVVRRKTSTKRK